jgi:GNAT superfamily N-acetyltransferase
MMRIRTALERDLPCIKALMREFSDYLNAIDEPEEVPDEIIDRIGPIVFGPNSPCTMLVAEDGDQVMGFLTYFWGLSMEGVGLAVFVGDLFVSAPYRRIGVGRTLMERTRVIAGQT